MSLMTCLPASPLIKFEHCWESCISGFGSGVRIPTPRSWTQRVPDYVCPKPGSKASTIGILLPDPNYIYFCHFLTLPGCRKLGGHEAGGVVLLGPR